MSKSKKVSEKDQGKLVDFDVIRENWHAYELEDDTIIRTKNILMTVIDVGSANEKEAGASGLRKYGFGMKLLNVVHSPKHLRDRKGKVWSLPELEKSIVQSNLKFRQIKDGGSSEYEVKKMKIIVLTRVTQVDKTSKFDPRRNPAYIVRIESQIMQEGIPEKKQKKSTTLKTA